MFPEEDSETKQALLGLGLFELAAAFTTQPEPSLGYQVEHSADAAQLAARDNGAIRVHNLQQLPSVPIPHAAPTGRQSGSHKSTPWPVGGTLMSLPG